MSASLCGGTGEQLWQAEAGFLEVLVAERLRRKAFPEPDLEILRPASSLCHRSFLVGPLRTRKRTDTRSRTACICPFKSIGWHVVLVCLEAPGQISHCAL